MENGNPTLPKETVARVAEARKRAAQARSRLRALQALLSRQSRKADTRRKLLLGALLFEAAKANGGFKADGRLADGTPAISARTVVERLKARLHRAHDRAAFGMSALEAPPTPTQENSAAEVREPSSDRFESA